MKITSDLHIHTNLSSCAHRDATFEGYVANAAKDGLTCLGFTDHLWDSARIPGVTGWYAPQNVEHVLQLKEKLPREMDGVRLLFGCETEFAYDGKLCLAEESFEHFDFVIVPHSHTHMGVVAPRERVADHKLHAEFIMETFMKLVTHPLAHKVLSAAHPFVPGTAHPTYDDVQKFIPNSYLYEAFAAAKESGIAIEMNGSCLVYKAPELIPVCEYVRIYSIAKECGCKFTYGSDSHDCNGDRQLKVVEAFMDQCGITEADMITVEDIFARKK